MANGFRMPATPSRREAQDAINQKMVEVTGKLTAVLQSQANKIHELEQRIALLEGDPRGVTIPDAPGTDLSLVTT